jgi:hypothetical protein
VKKYMLSLVALSLVAGLLLALPLPAANPADTCPPGVASKQVCKTTCKTDSQGKQTCATECHTVCLDSNGGYYDGGSYHGGSN